MPIYMDRHDLSGATAKDVAEAHQQDLSIQDHYGCRGLTYWFDEERGAAFCLIEAPNMDAVKNMHDHAHGLVPHQIIEVENNVVEAFLGRINDPQPENTKDDSRLLIINDPAFRAIMSINLEDTELIDYRYRDSYEGNIHQSYKLIIKEIINQFDGRQVEHVKDGFLISFSSIANATCSSIEIIKQVEAFGLNSGINIQAKIGLSAGVPVTKVDDFFGDTVQQSRQLCEIASGGQVLVSSFLIEYLRDNDLKQLNDQPSIRVFKSSEEEFLQHLNTVANTLWNNPGFSIELFNKRMGMSKSQLYRKTISVTGLSPSDFIKEYRLKMSLKQLSESNGNISDIAYDSGFSSPSYFSKCFQKRFGFSPSDFIRFKNE